MTHQFDATLDIIGINPYVTVPEDILQDIFRQCGRDKGPIPVQGTVNAVPYKQTLVRYDGAWRFYINTVMLKNSPKRIGEIVSVTMAYDPADRTLSLHPQLEAALDANPEAAAIFYHLPSHRRHEINRYICSLKTEASVERNIDRAIKHLRGQGSYAGRNTI